MMLPTENGSLIRRTIISSSRSKGAICTVDWMPLFTIHSAMASEWCTPSERAYSASVMPTGP